MFFIFVYNLTQATFVQAKLMDTNKLEISIEQDSKKENAELESMTIEVAKAFSVLIDSITKIVDSSPNKEKLKISIEKGSVRIVVKGEGLTQIKNDYLQVV